MYSNPFTVKLPLLRIAHPAAEECQKELEKIQQKIQEENEYYNRKETKHMQDEDEQEQLKIRKPSTYTPHLFNFEHHYDPELTPRKPWQQRVVHLDSLLEQQKQLQSDLEQKGKKEMNSLLLQLTSLKEEIRIKDENINHIEQEKQVYKRNNDTLDQQLKKLQNDLEKDKQRFLQDKSDLIKRINSFEETNQSLQRTIDKLNIEQNQLKDENNKLRYAIVNKDSENQTIKSLLEKERERREAETNELRKLFSQEQEKSIKAVRESEQNSTRIINYTEIAEKSEKIIDQKDSKIEKLNAELERLRKAQADIEIVIAKRIGDEYKKWESQQEDKTKSIEIKLNKRESDNEKMEKLLIEMHKKMDELKQQKDTSESEVKMLMKSIAQKDKDLEIIQYEQRQLREKFDHQLSELEKELQSKNMIVWKKDMVISKLEEQLKSLVEEVERLRNCKNLSESIIRLPQSCFEDIKIDSKVKEVKSSALHQAMKELKLQNKDQDQLLQQIEELEQKQKTAFIQLYQKVGQQITNSFDMKINNLNNNDEVDKKRNMKEVKANEIQDKLVKDQQQRLKEQSKENISIDELFKKYNI